MAAEEQDAIPGEEILLGYQNELAEANHKNIVLGAQNRMLQRQIREAVEDNNRLRKQLQGEQVAERNAGASASVQEADE